MIAAPVVVGPGGGTLRPRSRSLSAPRRCPGPTSRGGGASASPASRKSSLSPCGPTGSASILSPSNPENDLFKKLVVYQRAEVPHYWIIHPVAEALAVYRWTPDGYLLVVVARGDERVRAEPFEAVEFSVHSLVASDEDEEPESEG